jgi:cytochrome c peroxidase
MQSKKIIASLAIVLAIAILIACGSEEKKETIEQEPIDSEAILKMAKNVFGALPEIAPSSHYDITEEKVKLGKVLFFDTRLSKDGNISCNSCHQLDNFGVDGKKTSPGDDGTFGDRNSPTVLNAALHHAQFWDGRATDVEEQAGMPILNPIEHAIPDEKFLIYRLKQIDLYQELFSAAFPDEKEPLNYKNLTFAIGAFERTLLTPSRFDQFVNGDINALNDLEQRGIQAFVDAGCTSCHTGKLIGGSMFNKFGLFNDYWELTGSEKIDKGRFEITQDENDMYVFKVPSLRNIVHTAPYFHDGSVEKLEDAIQIMAKLQINRELDAKDLEAIVAFLNALTGDISDEVKTPPAELTIN